jgi:ADP-dependent NAD(P)H-hydrate dehydratase / NAD(P)H-hydrate epimerase
MKPDFWAIQAPGKPLFPELEWSRPENKLHAGKLLIVGGNQHGFAAPAEAYGHAQKAGAGSLRVLLPDAIRKLVGVIVPEAIFVPSTKTSGSFSQQALADLLENTNWADGVLFAGDLGRNSETAILLEKFLSKSGSAVTLTKDAIEYCYDPRVINRPNTLLVLSLSQLQRLGVAARFEKHIAFSMDLLHLSEWLHDFTARYPIRIITKHHDQILVAVDGKISTTKITPDKPTWRLETASYASVWWMQNPSKPFEALSTSILID